MTKLASIPFQRRFGFVAVGHAACIDAISPGTAHDVVVVGTGLDVVVATVVGKDDVDAVARIELVVACGVEYFVGTEGLWNTGANHVPVSIKQVGPGRIVGPKPGAPGHLVSHAVTCDSDAAGGLDEGSRGNFTRQSDAQLCVAVVFDDEVFGARINQQVLLVRCGIQQGIGVALGVLPLIGGGAATRCRRCSAEA